MNGYPEWTPVSEKPEKTQNCLVALSNRDNYVALYNAGSNTFERYPDSKRVNAVAWMPLPPAYEPPRFGWRNAKDDPPKRDGEYLVEVVHPIAGTPIALVCEYEVDSAMWCTSGRVFYWSHIEPTPE